MQQNNILFFQSTAFGADHNEPGLFELLLTHLNINCSIFEQTKIVVANHAMSSVLKDKITLRDGICANLDCVVLLGPVLDKIYLENNPHELMFNFSQAKYIIYDYLLNNQINTADSNELNNYIYAENEPDRERVYQLAVQLQQIFHEYLYLRTNEMINLPAANFPHWQKLILKHLFATIKGQQTFLDVYRYFMTLDLAQPGLKLPGRLFIFGLTSVYHSQLAIIQKLAAKVTIFWYYQPPSYEYYGDLLSTRARANLEKRLLRKPDLNLEDLYLTDGNQLLSNLGQQSREFIELLNANNIEVYNFQHGNNSKKKEQLTMLDILQEDIRQIHYRIAKDYRIDTGSRFYADPILLDQEQNAELYDLPNKQSSVKVNVCHNKMREVQVLFNEIAEILDKNPQTKLSEILVTAPDIDIYADYITAVFDNELVCKKSGESCKILYNITGNRVYKDYKILENFKLIINAPYQLNCSFLIEFLTQAELQQSIAISDKDIELIKLWLSDNATYFGYDETDYEIYGYQNYSVHSFKQFLKNLVLGSCFNQDILSANFGVPIYKDEHNHIFTPYDNIDSTQLALCNKLIIIIELFEELRNIFYINSEQFAEFSLATAHNLLKDFQQKFFFDEEALLTCDKFLGELLQQSLENEITLPILNQIIDEYSGTLKNRINFNGKISCVSMQYMRNIPFDYVYILGLNFGDYPTLYNPNQLSVLAKDWHLADRNYNNEDKQAFLDILLATKRRLFLSYIGRRETDNSPIKPSPVLSLFLTTLGQSFINFWQNSEQSSQKFIYKNILQIHSLHPFYNNNYSNYSLLWYQLAQVNTNEYINRRWDFCQLSRIALTDEQKKSFYKISIKKLCETFTFLNCNLYQVFSINQFNNDIELTDRESFSFFEQALAKKLYHYFEMLSSKCSTNQLKEYLMVKGILAYQHIGELQFEFYFTLYQKFIAKRGQQQVILTLSYPLKRGEEEILLELEDQLWIEDDKIILLDTFDAIASKELAKKIEEFPYRLKFKALIVFLLLQNGALIDQKESLPFQVILRQLQNNGESRDFNVNVRDVSLFDALCKYYLRSLSNPVLIHRGAIEVYAKARLELDRAGNLKNSLSQCFDKARNRYLLDFQNFELDKIKSDIIFASVAENYFEYIEEINGVNDIVNIGEILANLT